ncbi:putative RNA-binding family protein [Hibiscus syriacus]|uniref:RNA-binding family protein n=1 Tax=Hibiscus syriacus TaxID=106335 RepID=A0A6A2Y7B9_HIBSY|nr:putative RNA-binding family protein [Hibiscus syriacus]
MQIVCCSLESGSGLPPFPFNLLHSGSDWHLWALGTAIPLILSFTTSKWGPFLKLMNDAEKVLETAEHISDVVEEVAEKVEKIADEVGDQLPDGGKLRATLELVEDLAEETAKNAHLAGDLIDKAEPNMNAVALKRFGQANQKLAAECTNLFTQCNKWERECLLYDHDRLMPSTQKILSLAAEVMTLEKDKDHLRLNLSKAEEEVKVLFEENSILEEANQRLLRQSREGKNLYDSGGKHTDSASAKVRKECWKRKLSPRIYSLIEKKMNFTDPDSARKPPSPLQDGA